MQKEINTKTKEQEKTEKKVKVQSDEEGRPVGIFGIVLMTVYLILFSLLLLYSLMMFWPPAGKDADSSTITFLKWQCSNFNGEVRFLIIVAMAGALGSLVHALRSIYWYIGNRELKRSWLAMYILLPFVGATLGVIFYLVIRGGFFSPEATLKQISPFGFAAMASLVGLFSEQAVLKLKQVAENLFAKAQKGKNPTLEKKEDEEKKKEEDEGEGAAEKGDEHGERDTLKTE